MDQFIELWGKHISHAAQKIENLQAEALLNPGDTAFVFWIEHWTESFFGPIQWKTEYSKRIA